MKHNLLRTGFFALVMVSATTMNASAQDIRKLTLKEAIDLSIQNSNQLKNSQAKIEEATAATREAIERRLPDANISGSYIRLNNPNVDLKSKSGNGGGTGGGQQTASPAITQATYGLANISMPIYSGSRIRYGIESAKYLEEAARLDAVNDKEAVILNTINAYTNLFKAKASVELVKQSLEQSRQRVADFTNLEKNGLLARNDLLKAQLQASNIELSLMDAENNWKLADVNMNLMLGLPENTQLEIDSTVFQQAAEVKALEDYEELALHNREDITALSYRTKAATTGIKAAKGEYLPSIAVTGGYIAANVPNFVTITNAMNVGVGVQYNLSSLWKTKSKVQQAAAREKQLQASQAMLNDQVRLQINQAYQDFLLSNKKIGVLQTAVEQANENYRITKNKYDNSLVTTTDLLDAEVSQLQAKLNFSNSKADALVAYNNLLQAAGLLDNSQENK
jgi:outer membrane protein